MLTARLMSDHFCSVRGFFWLLTHWLLTTDYCQNLPGLGDIGVNLGRQGLDGGEAPFFPEAGDEVHSQVLAVQIFAEIKEVHFQGEFAVFEGGTGADVGHPGIDLHSPDGPERHKCPGRAAVHSPGGYWQWALPEV